MVWASCWWRTRFEEAIGLAHTIIVVKDGKMQKRFDYNAGNKPTPFDLLHHMV